MLKILILNNYKTLLKFILWASIIYAIAYYVSENNGMSNEEKIKIDSLNNVILKIQKDQLRLDSTIVEFNKNLEANPELVNSDSYGEGWMIKMKVANIADVEALMDAYTYKEHVGH